MRRALAAAEAQDVGWPINLVIILYRKRLLKAYELRVYSVMWVRLHIDIEARMPVQFQSPLSNLCDVLGEIKGSARQYQSILTKNEASTRAVLIDPVLRALGWDTANTHMVEIEKTLGRYVRITPFTTVTKLPVLLLRRKL
jgi:hypothetical protein